MDFLEHGVKFRICTESHHSLWRFDGVRLTKGAVSH